VFFIGQLHLAAPTKRIRKKSKEVITNYIFILLINNLKEAGKELLA